MLHLKIIATVLQWIAVDDSCLFCLKWNKQNVKICWYIILVPLLTWNLFLIGIIIIIIIGNILMLLMISKINTFLIECISVLSFSVFSVSAKHWKCRNVLLTFVSYKYWGYSILKLVHEVYSKCRCVHAALWTRFMMGKPLIYFWQASKFGYHKLKCSVICR